MGTSGADKQAPRGVVRGPAERGARQRVNASQCEALAEGQFICPEHRKKEGAPKSELFGEGRHEPGLYHHRVGIWVQVGRISRLPGASSGAPQSGARGSASMLRSAKHWRRGNSFAPSIGKKRVHKERALWGGTPRTQSISPPCGDMGTSGADKAKKTAGIGP